MKKIIPAVFFLIQAVATPAQETVWHTSSFVNGVCQLPRGSPFCLPEHEGTSAVPGNYFEARAACCSPSFFLLPAGQLTAN